MRALGRQILLDVLNASIIRDVIDSQVAAAMISCTELRRGLLPDKKARSERTHAGESAVRRDLASRAVSPEISP